MHFLASRDKVERTSTKFLQTITIRIISVAQVVDDPLYRRASYMDLSICYNLLGRRERTT